MPDQPPSYGETWAPVYDRFYPRDDDAEAVADVVAAVAGGGPVLEFAIGTGRLALPLAERGVAVAGLDSSPAMVRRLRAKRGGDQIPVTLGDMASTRVEGRFAVVLLAFNTLFVLPDQRTQVACFANAARHLTPGGAFVVEAFVPDPGRYRRGQRVGVWQLAADQVSLEVSRHDPVTQTVTSVAVTLGAGSPQLRAVDLRYAWPAELDLMARLAGLEPQERWGGWLREPFTAASTRHVSVYRRLGG